MREKSPTSGNYMILRNYVFDWVRFGSESPGLWEISQKHFGGYKQLQMIPLQQLTRWLTLFPNEWSSWLLLLRGFQQTINQPWTLAIISRVSPKLKPPELSLQMSFPLSGAPVHVNGCLLVWCFCLYCIAESPLIKPITYILHMSLVDCLSGPGSLMLYCPLASAEGRAHQGQSSPRTEMLLPSCIRKIRTQRNQF